MNPEDFLDTRGHIRTVSIFKETMPDSSKKAGYEPLMTLKESSVGGLPSMHQMFIEDRDPTGYTTCMRTVGVWRHWQKIWSNKVLKKHMDAWKEELDTMLMAEGIQKMRESNTPAAAKYLAERGWEKKAGRPSKAAVDREARRMASIENDLRDDAARLRAIND